MEKSFSIEKIREILNLRIKAAKALIKEAEFDDNRLQITHCSIKLSCYQELLDTFERRSDGKA